MSKTTIKAALALDTVWKLSTEANRGGIDCKKKAHPDFMGQPGCARGKYLASEEVMSNGERLLDVSPELFAWILTFTPGVGLGRACAQMRNS